MLQTFPPLNIKKIQAPVETILVPKDHTYRFILTTLATFHWEKSQGTGGQGIRWFSRSPLFKEGLYRIGCGVNRLGESGVHTLGDTSAFFNPAVSYCYRRGKTRSESESERYLFDPHKKLIQSNNEKQLGSGDPY